jgi:hypothetical protein
MPSVDFCRRQQTAPFAVSTAHVNLLSAEVDNTILAKTIIQRILLAEPNNKEQPPTASETSGEPEKTELCITT